MTIIFEQVSTMIERKRVLIGAGFCHNHRRWQMSETVIVQYRGFEVKLLVREYTFNVREAGSEREFTLSIENEAFVSHRARYQDAPSICSQRLNAELSAHANHPPESVFAITSAELDTFREARTPKVAPSPYARKPQEDY
jgi:hypothetical protein